MTDKRKRTTNQSKPKKKVKGRSSNADPEPSSARNLTTEKGSQRASVEEVSDDSEDEDENAECVRISERDEPEEDPEAQLTRLKENWTAVVYAFYKLDVSIVHINGRRAHRFHCAGLGCKSSVLRYLGTNDSTSTSNLRKHVRTCKSWGEEALNIAEMAGLRADKTRECLQDVVRSGSIEKAFERKGKGKVTYSARQHSRNETRAEIVRWVCANLRPVSIVEDEGFKTLMKTGRPSYWIPSRVTVSRDIKNVFKNVRERIAKMLRDYPGKLNFTTDCWTSPNHRAFAAFAVHLEHNGDPLAFPLDFVEIPESHTGETLAREFNTMLRNFGIEAKLHHITTDSATSNNVMVRKLGACITEFPGIVNHVHCFDHVVSLSAKSVLSIFDITDTNDGSGDATLEKAEKALQELAKGLDLEEAANYVLGDMEDDDAALEGDEERTNVDDLLDEVTAAMDPTEVEEFRASALRVRTVLVKLRKISFAIINSSTILLPAWRQIIARHGLSNRLMPRDVRTRWNSTYTMLSFAIEYRAAIDEIAEDRNMQLRNFELSDEEWVVAGQLCELLKIFYDATQFFSRKTPNLAVVIPAMDRIDEHLATASIDKKYASCIRAGASLGKKTINRYYDLTDGSESYRIAMVLNPRYKLAYFKNAKWPEHWIETAKNITRNEYERSYARSSATDNEGIIVMDQEQSTSTQPVSSKSSNMFDNLFDDEPEVDLEVLTNEFEDFISKPLETKKTCPDPMRWWYEQRERYPHLSRMALDYLSIPATSVDVERMFSRGRILLPHVRNRLTGQSIRAILCVSEWTRLGLVKDVDINHATKQPENVSEEVFDEVAVGWDAIESTKTVES